MSNSNIANALRAFTRDQVKQASGDPESTNGPGDGVAKSHQADRPSDEAESSLTSSLPADQKPNESQAHGGQPDRMTAADGNGGVTDGPASAPKDPAVDDLTSGMPSDDYENKKLNKAASLEERISNIRQAIRQQTGQDKQAAGQADPTGPANKDQTQPSKQAGDDPFDDDTLTKLARDVLSTEEGVSFVNDLYEKRDGRNAAQARIKEALEASKAYDQGEQQKQAAYDYVGQLFGNTYSQLKEAGVTEDVADYILKTAADHENNLDRLQHPLEKKAYAAGMGDAAAIEGAAEEGADPEAAMGGGEALLSPEELMMALEELVASGQISEEELMAALAELEAAGAGGEGGIPAEAEATPELIEEPAA